MHTFFLEDLVKIFIIKMIIRNDFINFKIISTMALDLHLKLFKVF